MEVPKVFISYSHDSIEHKKWILSLAIRLRNNGIDAILDQFELKPGDDIPSFMEKYLSNCNKILMVCTENYVSKANTGTGGVGYEKMIITSNLMKNIDENKIIPIIRQLNPSNVPTFLKTKLHINFHNDSDFEFSYDELVRTIHNTPLFVKPPVGNNPFKPIEKVNQEENITLIDKIMKLVIDDYAIRSNPSDRYIDTSVIMNELEISRILAEVTAGKVVSLGLVQWKNVNERIVITEKGKLYAIEKGLA
jgi:hypothetical protein